VVFISKYFKDAAFFSKYGNESVRLTTTNIEANYYE